MNLSTGNGIRIGRGLAAIFATLALAFVVLAQAVTTTTVQGTVYFANGQPGSGTVQIQWPSFTTAAGQTIAAGSNTVTIGSDGFLTVNLAPNQDATPAGLFYTVTYYLSNGATNTEYWVVPDAAQATLAQVRSTVMPSSQAIQTVSKAYVDQAIANISQGGLAPTGGTLTGPLYLAGDPTSSLQAADKHYVDTSVAQSVPLSGATLTGALVGPSVNASVNNVINVMAPPYNAKGDCVTDDQAAIQAALNAAQADTSSNAVVYFPTPPGGCYLTSQLSWYGVSLRGEAGNNQNGQTWQGVTLKGKPGQDILHTGDPNSTASVPTRLWSIDNIRFLLDDSVDASGSSGSFAHRWPGKWVGDGAMTSGSATLTSTYGMFSCGDIGQAVVVKGAGASGADLTTTISSVTPCYGPSPTSVTLAASASSTVTSAAVYIADAGMSATQQIGNCAIAMDNSDGDSANWQGSSDRLPLYDNLHNVNFSTTSGQLLGQNNSCAIFFQGVYMPYGLDARNVNITHFVYGVVWGLSDVNPLGSSNNNTGVGQDYQVWDHGDWVDAYPWISFNGGQNKLVAIQLYDAAGPQFLQVKSPSEAGGSRWTIRMPEQEQPSNSTGMRVELTDSDLSGSQLASNAGNYPAYIGGNDNQCLQCDLPQTLNLGGIGNVIQGTYVPNTVNDGGIGNTVTGLKSNSNYAGQTPTEQTAETATKGSEPWGRLSADFVRTGNLSTPYMNLEDLLFLPGDVRWLSGYPTVVYPDSNSITGKYNYTNGTYTSMAFSNSYGSVLTGKSGNYVIGGTTAGTATVPATRVTLYASVKCPSVTSYSLTVRAGSTTVASATPACSSTGYTVGSVTADLSTYAGQDFGFTIGSGSGEVDWAYVAVRPFQADYNGYQPAQAGPNSDITSLTGLTTPLSAAQGGTGSTGISGIRYGNGSSPDTAATATQVNTVLQGLANCNTSGYVYSPQSGSCVAQGSGGGSLPTATAQGQQLAASGAGATYTAVNPGVINVRTMYGGVPDGSTDNSTAIANAFTAANAVTTGSPTVYFDCSGASATCEYNYGGSGISPINPLRAMTIECASNNVLLNYTGTAHAVDVGQTGLSISTIDKGLYTFKNCGFTGGASMTQGFYLNNYIVNIQFTGNQFLNFGNLTGASIYSNLNNWYINATNNLWMNTDGTFRNAINLDNGANSFLYATGNMMFCLEPGGLGCPVSGQGYGIWLGFGKLADNQIGPGPVPAIRFSTAGVGAPGVDLVDNHIEGNPGNLTAAIEYGDPGGTAANLNGLHVAHNTFYWPAASNVNNIVTPNTPSSGEYTLQQSTFFDNLLSPAPTGTAKYLDFTYGIGDFVYANTGPTAASPLDYSSSNLVDATSTKQIVYDIQFHQNNGTGPTAYYPMAFDSAAHYMNVATYHGMSLPMRCNDTSGSGTAQSCSTAPRYDNNGTQISPVAGDCIVYSTTTTNTGALTLAVNGSSAAPVQKRQGTVALVAGDLLSGKYVQMCFDGTNWDLTDPITQ